MRFRLFFATLAVVLMAAGCFAGDVLNYKAIGPREQIEGYSKGLFSDDGEERRAAAIALKDMSDMELARLGAVPEAEGTLNLICGSMADLLDKGKATTRIRAERVLYDIIEGLSEELKSEQPAKVEAAKRLLPFIRDRLSKGSDNQSSEKLLAQIGEIEGALNQEKPPKPHAVPTGENAASSGKTASGGSGTGGEAPINTAETASPAPRGGEEAAAATSEPPTAAPSVEPAKAAAVKVEGKAADKPSGKVPSPKPASAGAGSVIAIVADQLQSDEESRVVAGLKLTARISGVIAASIANPDDPQAAAVGAKIRELIRSRDPVVRKHAAEAAGALKDALAVPDLVAIMDDADETVSSAAKDALSAIVGRDLGPGPGEWLKWAGSRKGN